MLARGFAMISRLSRFAVCFLTFFALSAPAPAASILSRDNRFTVSYGVYGGGFQALAIDVAFDFDKVDYTVAMNAKPYGVLGSLLPWAGLYQTKGIVQKGVLQPVEHDRISAWRDDKSHVIMSYKNGVLTKLEEIENEKGKESKKNLPLDKSYHKGTVDLVTGVIDMLIRATDKNNCTYARDMYDGRRRFRMTFKDQGMQTITPSAVNIFSGKAHLCRMELVPLKGFTGKPRGYYRIQEEARTKGELPVVWLGQAWKNGPLIPVRMMVKSEYGTVLMHLKKIKR